MKKMLVLLSVILFIGFMIYYLNRNNNNELPLNTDPDNNGDRFLDLHNTDSIIAALSLSSDNKTKAKSWVRTINNAVKNGTGNWSRKTLEDNAAARGFTYAQQTVLSAIWQMYATSMIISKDQYKNYEAEITALGE